MRLTKKARQQLLAQNEGFETETYRSGKNFRESRQYKISNGELHFRSRGKTSWAASRFDEEHVADEAATHRFLYNNLRELDTDGVE